MSNILNVESIKAQANIVQVVSSFLPLQKNGENYKCCCPFHNENTPSFVVSEKKQIFHCFGCGVGGDVFKFVQDFKKLDFVQSVEMVANALGLRLEYAKGQTNEPKSKYKEMVELNTALNEIFMQNLAEPKNEMAKKCKDYLIKRGLSNEDFTHYEIGFIPNTQEILARLSGTQSALALDLGFLRKNKEREGYYCPLSERISFALRNSNHQIVGFSGRSHPYKNFRNAGKYINSSESEVFKKSLLLYRFTHAKSVIYSQKCVFVVEGFMDALALDKMGIKNAVATCGTAFGLSHLSQLIKIPEIEIIFCFDKDEAGGKAAQKSLELCYKANFYNAKVAWANNSVKDFGEVLEKGEKLELKEINGFEFLLKYKIKHAQNNAQKEAVLNYAKEVIKNCPFYFEKQSLLENAATALKIPSNHFTSPMPKVKNDILPPLEKVIIKSALYNEQMAYILREVVASEGKEFLASAQTLYDEFCQNTKSQNLTELELDERIQIIINTNAFSEVLKSLRKQYLQMELEKAKYRKDIDKMIFLQSKVRDLEMPF